MLYPYQNYKFCKQTGETPNKHGNSYTITQNSDTITETADFCVIVQFLPNRPFISDIKNAKKRGPPTTVMNPTKPKKPS